MFVGNLQMATFCRCKQAVFKLKLASESLGGLVEGLPPEFLIQQVEGRALESAFLTSPGHTELICLCPAHCSFLVLAKLYFSKGSVQINLSYK